MSGFEPGEADWIEGLDKLRNVIRQELISRQLAPYAHRGMTVLDVGCGQGTQALRLARLGCQVTGVDRSPDLLDRFASAAAATGVSVELLEGELEALDRAVGDRRFDLVCAHGVLMYLRDRRGAIGALASRLGPGGHLSFTFRNGHALAMRPGLRRDWAGAISAFGTATYSNELGLVATAHRLEDIESDLAAVGLSALEWFGVRVFNDAIAVGTTLPPEEDLALLLEAEDMAGRRDPYRWMASQLHVVAARGS